MPAEERRRYEAAGVAIEEGAGVEVMVLLSAPVAVTASSGVARDLFGDRVQALVHMPHSIASLHMIYPADAFDGYDVIFAVGPHHEAEFSALGAWRNLAPRRCFPVGYGKADLLLDDSARVQAAASTSKSVLLAPSWGPHSLLPTMSTGLVEALLSRGQRVVLRPHPLHVLEREPSYEAIVQAFSGSRHISVELPDARADAMRSADVLITDYSGTAFEFALLRHRPVVFVDVPRKVVNENWEQIGLAPVEVALRGKIGRVVPPDAAAVANAAAELAEQAEQWHDPIAAALPSFLYRRENCATAAADAIGTLRDSVSLTPRRARAP